MPNSQLQEFLDGGGSRPYRELVQHHVNRTPVRQLQMAVMGEAARCPITLSPDVVMEFIDLTGAQLGYDKEFWKLATCREALDRIVDIAALYLPREAFGGLDDTLLPANHDLVFCLFQIATLSFAYSASLQRKQRKFMGIRKGILG